MRPVAPAEPVGGPATTSSTKPGRPTRSTARHLPHDFRMTRAPSHDGSPGSEVTWDGSAYLAVPIGPNGRSPVRCRAHEAGRSVP